MNSKQKVSYNEGIVRYRDKDYQRALKCFTEAGDFALENVANCYYRMGQLERAVENWRKLPEKTDITKHTKRKIIDCYLKLAKYDKLNEMKTEMSVNKTESDLSLINYITAMVTWKKDSNKQEALELLKQCGNLEDALHQISKLEKEFAQIESTIKALKEDTKQEDCPIAKRLELGKLYYERHDNKVKDINQAMVEFNKVIEKGSCFEAYKYLGLCYKEQNNYEHAIKIWEGGKSAFQEAEFDYLMARLFFERDSEKTDQNLTSLYSDALQQLDEIDKKETKGRKPPERFLLEAEIYERKGAWTEALNSYRNYLRVTAECNTDIEAKKKRCLEEIKKMNTEEAKIAVTTNKQIFLQKETDSEENQNVNSFYNENITSTLNVNPIITPPGKFIQFKNDFYVEVTDDNTVSDIIYRKFDETNKDFYQDSLLKLKNLPLRNVMKYNDIIGNTYVSMPFYQGGSLYENIHSGNDNYATTFSLKTKVNMIIQICEGLKGFESISFYHKKLNPHNIFLKKRLRKEELPELFIGDYLFVEPSERNLNWVNPNTSLFNPSEQYHMYCLKLIIWEILTGDVPKKDIIDKNQYETKGIILQKLQECTLSQLSDHYSLEIREIFKSNDLTLNHILSLFEKMDTNKKATNRFTIVNQYNIEEAVFDKECLKYQSTEIQCVNVLKKSGCLKVGNYSKWEVYSLENVNCFLSDYLADISVHLDNEKKINLISQVVNGVLYILKQNWHIPKVDDEQIALSRPSSAKEIPILKIFNYGITEEYINMVKKFEKKTKLMSTFIYFCVLVCCKEQRKLDEFFEKRKEFIERNKSDFPLKVYNIILRHFDYGDLNFDSIFCILEKN